MELKSLSRPTFPHEANMEFKYHVGTSPEGLTWDGEYLWNADEDDAVIRKLEAGTGDVISTIDVDHPPEGLAWDPEGPYLWYCSERDDVICKLDPETGDVLDSFSPPAGDPDGLAWDGENLWNSDDGQAEIYKIDPETGDVLKSFSSPGNDPDGLAFDRYGRLWCCDGGGYRFTRLDTKGNVICGWSSPEGVVSPSGLGWGQGALWMSMDSDSEIWKITDVPYGRLGVLRWES